MVRADFRIDSKALRAALKKTPDSLLLWVTKAFDQHGQVYKREMQGRFGASLSDGKNPNPAGGKLASRSGNLQGTIGYEIVRRNKLNGLALNFFIGDANTFKYAITQEEGRVIYGRPFLAIPLPPNLTGTGRSRIERPSLVRGNPDFALIRTKEGKLLIGKPLKDGKFEAWWILVRKVTIPARLGFVDTVNGEVLRKDRIARVGNALKRALQEATKGG